MRAGKKPFREACGRKTEAIEFQMDLRDKVSSEGIYVTRKCMVNGETFPSHS